MQTQKTPIVFLVALTVALVSMLSSSGQAQPIPGTISILEALENEVRALVDGVAPSVVTVRCIAKNEASGKSGTRTREPRAMTVGSGIILDTLGRILTTARVVENADDYWISLWDGRLFRAIMLGVDGEIAVLQITATGLESAPIEAGADSRRTEYDLGVGSFVAAVGNSYGFAGGLSWGEVNGFRPDGTIQLSMGVSAGGSGGALVNTRGQVIGIVRARISEPFYINPMHLPATENQPALVIPGRRLELPTSSVSLAIPINIALRSARRVTESGETAPAYVGVYVSDLHGWHKAHFKTQDGVLVTGVVEKTPAHRYGVLRGDVITRVNREPVQSVQRFRQVVIQAQPGERLMFDLIRGGKPLKLVVVAGRADLPHLGSPTERPTIATPAVSRTAGTGMTALRLLQAKERERDSLLAPSGAPEAWEERLRSLEEVIDSLRREIDGLQ